MAIGIDRLLDTQQTLSSQILEIEPIQVANSFLLKDATLWGIIP